MVSAGRGDAESLVGTTIAGKYFVHQLLGRGGMGDVYKATLLGPDRPVALKLLSKGSSDPTLPRRFEREVAAASRLRHPNAIEVVDFGETSDGSPYLAMEFVPGHTLAQVISAEAPLPPARAVHLLAQVLAALADAHANGVIHRDLKPANVMIDPLRDAAGFVKVLDFGIATLGESSQRGEAPLTGRDMVYGTPAYMSPEQIRGEPLDARSDLYSAAVMLFEMLSGVPPFDAPTPMAIAAKHLIDPAPRLSERRPGVAVPPALEALLARTLEKRPALRPASAEAMRADLVASLGALPERPRGRELPRTEGFPRAAAPERPRRSFGGRAALALVGAAGVVAVALLVVTRREGTRGDAAPATAAAQAGAPASLAQPATMERPLALAPAAAPILASEGEPRAASPARGSRRAVAERRPEAHPRPVRIQLVRGELNSVPTPPAATGDGVLVLVATPWAELELEGIPLGETPREVRLRAGTYAVRAVHPELGKREDRVVVAAGERKLWAARYEP